MFGVLPNVSQAELRRAYLSRSKVSHPDTINKSKKPKEWLEANKVSQELNTAYFILRDSTSRAQYDSSIVTLDASRSGTDNSTGVSDNFRPRPYSSAYVKPRVRHQPPASYMNAEAKDKALPQHWSYPKAELDGWFGVFAQWLFSLPPLGILTFLVVVLSCSLTMLFWLYGFVISFITS